MQRANLRFPSISVSTDYTILQRMPVMRTIIGPPLLTIRIDLRIDWVEEDTNNPEKMPFNPIPNQEPS